MYSPAIGHHGSSVSSFKDLRIRLVASRSEAFCDVYINVNKASTEEPWRNYDLRKDSSANKIDDG